MVANAHPGAIVIQHDGGGDRSETLAALPQEIQTLRSRGYQFVTVTQLFGDEAARMTRRPPADLADGAERQVGVDRIDERQRELEQPVHRAPWSTALRNVLG